MHCLYCNGDNHDALKSCWWQCMTVSMILMTAIIVMMTKIMKMMNDDSDHHKDDNDHEKENFSWAHPYQCQKQWQCVQEWCTKLLFMMTMIMIQMIAIIVMIMMTTQMKLNISGWPTTSNAKSSDSMLTSDALHLHESSGLQLCLWLVLWISLAGLFAIIITNTTTTIIY